MAYPWFQLRNETFSLTFEERTLSSLTSFQVPFEIVSFIAVHCCPLSWIYSSHTGQQCKRLLCFDRCNVKIKTYPKAEEFVVLQTTNEFLLWIPLTSQGGMWPLLALEAWCEFGFEAQPSKGGVCVQWSLILPKTANKVGADARWIKRTEIFNHFSEDNS